MKPTLFLIIFYYSVYSQNNSVSLKNQIKPQNPSGYVRTAKKSECSGLNKQIYSVTYNEKGLVFEKCMEQGSNNRWIEKIIIPSKNELNFRVNSVPQIACDLSQHEFKGRIYICWSDLKNGSKNEDVFLVYSDDEGENWTEPILITYYPNHKSQFKPTLMVNKLNGKLYVLYYDNQNSLKNNFSDMILAISQKGGMKFDYFKLNKKTFFMPTKYPWIETKNNSEEMNVFWVEKNKAVASLKISDSTLNTISKKNNAKELTIEKTFLFKDTIEVPFYIEHDEIISAAITKPLEPNFERIVLKDKKYKKGKCVLSLKTKELSMKKGSFILTLYYNQKNNYCWITEE